jgi:hypothetical protein
MIVLAEPDPSDMVQAIKKAISILPKIDPQAMHNRVSASFNINFGLYENLTTYTVANLLIMFPYLLIDEEAL